MDGAKWIWVDNFNPDVHAEFLCKLGTLSENALLEISCDGNYAVFLNGKNIGFGQMSDYEFYKLRDGISLGSHARAEENELRVLVWHIGVNTVNYRAERAEVWFRVSDNGRTVARSDEKTLSRVCRKFKTGYLRTIAQVGITSLYDFTVKDDEFSPSVPSDKKVTFADDNAANLIQFPAAEGRAVVREKKRVLVDLGEEFFGFMNFSVESRSDGNAFTVFFGEHLLPEKTVLRDIANCHFGLDFIAKKGKNEFYDYLRPIGCRYLEIVADDEISVERLGITPFGYPFKEKKFHLNNGLDDEIYGACVNTLKKCASKHYIDCPWREQGMYVLDSRNQMLCGYYVFGEFALARFNIVFLSKGLMDCGLLCSCPPSAQENFIIPFFSLIYILQVYEYVELSGDVSVIERVSGTLDAIMRTFTDKIDENGLIPRFSYTKFWNFYEWTAGSDGWPCDRKASIDRKDDETYDVILNSAFVIAAEKYAALKERIGEFVRFSPDKTREKIKETFYDEERGLFRLNSRSREYGRLGCSMALLAKAVRGEEAARVAKNALNDKDVADCSLACAAFFYDALLSVNPDYKDFVLRDIRLKYGYMLDCGATTFWETLRGSAENGGIGSLCHGWSAMPAYYYHKFFSE